MKLDARTILLAGGLLVLLALGVYSLSRSLSESFDPDRTAVGEGRSAPPAAPAELHPDLAAGLEALKKDDLQLARELLEKVPASHPTYSVALHRLSAVYERSGENRLALEALDRLVGIQPDNPETHLALGWALYRSGRFDQAELAALHALEVEPQHLTARYDVALFRVAMGEVADAVRAYHRALGMDRQRRHLVRAETHLRELESQLPELADVHYALAYFGKVLGAREQEAASLERYLAIAPQGPVADVARARLEEARAALDLQGVSAGGD